MIVLYMIIIAAISVTIIGYLIGKKSHASNAELRTVANDIREEVGKLKAITAELKKIKEQRLNDLNKEFNIKTSQEKP